MKTKKLNYFAIRIVLNRIFTFSTLVIFSLLSSNESLANSSLEGNINFHQKEYENIALSIWDLAEVGYQEYESSNLLKESLKKKGFTIEENIANIPTAFTAEFGNGFPIINKKPGYEKEYIDNHDFGHGNDLF